MDADRSCTRWYEEEVVPGNPALSRIIESAMY